MHIGSLEEIVRLATVAAVFALMFSAGLGMVPGHLMYFRRRPLLLLKSLIAVLVLVPMAAVLVVFVIKPVHSAAVGLAVMASSPAAPLMLTRASRAAGRLDYVGSLHLILAVLSIVTTPVTLAVLSRVIGFEAAVEPSKIAKLAFKAILLPVGLGLLVRMKFPGAAARIMPPLTKAGALLLLAIIVVLFSKTIGLIFDISLHSYAAMALFLCLALAAGHFTAPDTFEERTALALEAAARNPGFALVIAQLNFPHAKPLAFIIPYLLVFAVLSGAYLVWHKRSARR